MPLETNRYIAQWAAHEKRAAIYGRLLGVALFLLGLSLLNNYRAWDRPREVVRVGCDGIPQLVRINDEVYSEPDDREIKAFVSEWAIRFARSDSGSVLHDLAWCAMRMTPELRAGFVPKARGTKEQPGIIATVESLNRRTDVAPSSLQIQIDKSTYPWRITAMGERQIVGQESAANQKFKLYLSLVRASRNDVIEGMLVYSVRADGEALDTPVKEHR